MFKKPDTKTITSMALSGVAIVGGAKVGDGISAVMPESTNSYKRWILGVGGLVAAACISPNTTSAKVAQNALIGLGSKQLYDELSETLSEAIPAKTASGTTDRFINAVVGHKDTVPVASLGSAWIGDNVWERPLNEDYPTQASISFTGL